MRNNYSLTQFDLAQRAALITLEQDILCVQINEFVNRRDKIIL